MSSKSARWLDNRSSRPRKRNRLLVRKIARSQLRGFSKNSRVPRRPFEKGRPGAELKIIGKCGLKNKKYIWRVRLVLAKMPRSCKIRSTARVRIVKLKKVLPDSRPLAGLMARGRGRSGYRSLFNQRVCCHRQSSIRTHGYNNLSCNCMQVSKMLRNSTATSSSELFSKGGQCLRPISS